MEDKDREGIYLEIYGEFGVEKTQPTNHESRPIVRDHTSKEEEEEAKYNWPEKSLTRTRFNELIDLIVDQTCCSRQLASEALMKAEGDLVNAILDVSR